MSDQKDIPVLNDLIESGIEIKLSDLGLDDADDPPLRVEDVMDAELEFEADEANDAAHYTPALQPTSPFIPASLAAIPPGADALADNPALEQAVRRILDEHMELAWQEIRLAIAQHLDRS
jgi:hypothetical protein